MSVSQSVRKQVASRSQASCKLASNLLQTKSMLAAMKKRKHSTWGKQYIGDRHRYDAYSTVLPEMKANDMVDTYSNFRMDVGTFCVS